MNLDMPILQQRLFRRLESELYSSVDRELVSRRLESYFTARDLSKMGRVVGRGRDFYAIQDSLASSYVYIVPHSERFRDLEGVFFRDWYRVFQKLTRLSSPLIPPMLDFKSEKYFGLVMPYGDTFVSYKDYERTMVTLGDDSLALTALISYHEQIIRGANLYFDDLPQIRMRTGIPFLVDYGDLKVIRDR
jgi:hypothetical protein